MTQPNGNGPHMDEQEVAQAVQPRPVPVGWATEVVPFSNGTDRVHLIRLVIMSSTGQHHIFMAPADMARMAKDLRSAVKDASSRDNGLITPPSGLIIPGQ